MRSVRGSSVIFLAFVTAVALRQCAAFVHPSALLGMPLWPSEHRAASSANVRLSDFCHDKGDPGGDPCHVMSCGKAGDYLCDRCPSGCLIVTASRRAHVVDVITTYA